MKPMTPRGTRTFAISMPFGRRPPSDGLADRIRQRRDLADARHHPVDPRVGEGQAVEEGPGVPLAAGRSRSARFA
jgi:hypothetical protein